jgi:hypothetical protein
MRIKRLLENDKRKYHLRRILIFNIQVCGRNVKIIYCKFQYYQKIPKFNIFQTSS